MSGKNDLKKQLENLQNQLESMSSQLKSMESRQGIESRRVFLAQLKLTFFLLSLSIFISAVIGVVGNWFVALLFEPATQTTQVSIWFSGLLLISLLGVFLYDIIWIMRNWSRFLSKAIDV